MDASLVAGGLSLGLAVWLTTWVLYQGWRAFRQIANG